MDAGWIRAHERFRTNLTLLGQPVFPDTFANALNGCFTPNPLAEEQTEEEKRHEIRQDLVEDFVAIGGEDEDEDGHGFKDLIGDMQDEEDHQEQRGNDEDADAYALFCDSFFRPIRP